MQVYKVGCTVLEASIHSSYAFVCSVTMLSLYIPIFFSAVVLFVGQQEEHPIQVLLQASDSCLELLSQEIYGREINFSGLKLMGLPNEWRA